MKRTSSHKKRKHKSKRSTSKKDDESQSKKKQKVQPIDFDARICSCPTLQTVRQVIQDMKEAQLSWDGALSLKSLIAIDKAPQNNMVMKDSMMRLLLSFSELTFSWNQTQLGDAVQIWRQNHGGMWLVTETIRRLQNFQIQDAVNALSHPGLSAEEKDWFISRWLDLHGSIEIKDILALVYAFFPDGNSGNACPSFWHIGMEKIIFETKEDMKQLLCFNTIAKSEWWIERVVVKQDIRFSLREIQEMKEMQSEEDKDRFLQLSFPLVDWKTEEDLKQGIPIFGECEFALGQLHSLFPHNEELRKYYEEKRIQFHPNYFWIWIDQEMINLSNLDIGEPHLVSEKIVIERKEDKFFIVYGRNCKIRVASANRNFSLVHSNERIQSKRKFSLVKGEEREVCTNCQEPFRMGIWLPCKHEYNCRVCEIKLRHSKDGDDNEDDNEDDDGKPTKCPVCREAAVFVTKETIHSSIESLVASQD